MRKNKLLKRTFSLLVAIIMTSCLIPVTSFAEETQLSGKCSDTITWSYDTDTKVLSYEGTGDMIQSYQNKYFFYLNKLPCSKITVSDGITSFYQYCRDFVAENPDTFTIEFGKDIKKINYQGLRYYPGTSLFIPGTIETIDYFAFERCYNIKEVTFGDGVKTIKKSAFNYCTNLKKVTIPSSVTEIDYNAIGYYSDEIHYGKYKGVAVEGEVGSAAYNYCQHYSVDFEDINGCKQGNHIWGDVKEAFNKTCTDDKEGFTCRQCKNCGSRTDYKAIGTGHYFSNNSTVIVKKPTYFAKGLKKDYCKRCNKFITRTIAKKILYAPKYKYKEYKKQIDLTFTNTSKDISYYKVLVYKYDNKIHTVNKYKNQSHRTYIVKNKKLSISGLKGNVRYCIIAYSYHKEGSKIAKSALSYKYINAI